MRDPQVMVIHDDWMIWFLISPLNTFGVSSWTWGHHRDIFAYKYIYIYIY